MMNRKWQLVIAGCSCLVALLFVVAEVEAIWLQTPGGEWF